MNKIVKMALMGAGGLVLFVGSYVGIALISGAPLHEVAGISMFVDAPEEPEEGEENTEVADASEADEPKTGAELLNSNAGLLGAFMMDAPFSATELRGLENELKKKLREQTIEREALEVRSLELDEWEHSLRERQSELANLRTKLEELEGKIDLRKAELERDESVAEERERQGWRDMADLFEGGDAQSNAMMIQAESPEDAALILRELDGAKAGEILRLIQPVTERKRFTDAYRLAVTTQGD